MSSECSFLHTMVSQAYESAFLPALEQSGWVAREWLRAQQMCELASPWVGLKLVFYMFSRWLLRRWSAPARLPPSAGPGRNEMLAELE